MSRFTRPAPFSVEPRRQRTREKVAQVGFEPTASLLLEQSGLPVAYRAVDLRRRAHEESSPGWTRTTESSLCKSDAFATGLQDHVVLQWTHTDLHRDFR